MAPHQDFERILSTIEGLCCDYQRLNNPYHTDILDERETQISRAFGEIRQVIDVDEAYTMAERLVAILRDNRTEAVRYPRPAA